MLDETYKALRPSGLLVAILPSCDTIKYLKDLTYRWYLKKGLSVQESVEKVRREFEGNKHMDVETGLFTDDGEHVQKGFFEDERASSLSAAKFSITWMKKVTYPWKVSRKYAYGYCPGEAEIYDWFVVATKSEVSKVTPCESDTTSVLGW